MIFWPTVYYERTQALHEITDPPAMKRNGLIVSIVLFWFATVAATAFHVLMEMMGVSQYILPAVVCIVAAEWLITELHFFGSGLESGLWASALVLLIMALPSSGRPEAILVFALAAAIVGVRMLSATFGALAAILVIAYAGVKWTSIWPAVAVSFVIALAAVAALTRTWQRPSTERLFAFIAVVAPLAGYVSALVRGDGKSQLALSAAYAILGTILLIMAIPRRDLATLIASWIAIGIAIAETRDAIPLAVEVKVMLAGALLVAVAAAISRALRDKKGGFVIAPSTLTRLDEAMQILGTLPAAAPAHAAAPRPQPGGGAFGGAGASGEY